MVEGVKDILAAQVVLSRLEPRGVCRRCRALFFVVPADLECRVIGNIAMKSRGYQ